MDKTVKPIRKLSERLEFFRNFAIAEAEVAKQRCKDTGLPVSVRWQELGRYMAHLTQAEMLKREINPAQNMPPPSAETPGRYHNLLATMLAVIYDSFEANQIKANQIKANQVKTENGRGDTNG